MGKLPPSPALPSQAMDGPGAARAVDACRLALEKKGGAGGGQRKKDGTVVPVVALSPLPASGEPGSKIREGNRSGDGLGWPSPQLPDWSFIVAIHRPSSPLLSIPPSHHKSGRLSEPVSWPGGQCTLHWPTMVLARGWLSLLCTPIWRQCEGNTTASPYRTAVPIAVQVRQGSQQPTSSCCIRSVPSYHSDVPHMLALSCTFMRTFMHTLSNPHL